jgi:hypothetical protein
MRATVYRPRAKKTAKRQPYIGSHVTKSSIARDVSVILAANCLFLLGSLAKSEQAYPIAWVRQLGTPNSDSAYGVSFDNAGNIFFTGLNYGTGSNAANYDAFLGKYNSNGNLMWSRQLGTPAYDAGRGVSVDAQGNAFITGETYGSLGGPNLDGWDAYLSKYSADGNILWTRQFGASTWDESLATAVDGDGNVVIGGFTEGGLGDQLWGGRDAFLAKYDTNGNRLWIRQIGTPQYDDGLGVATDKLGNTYITGSTEGAMGGPNAGSIDAFVSKFDQNGVQLWTRQFGGSDWDIGEGVVVDASGNVIVGGQTRSSLGRPHTAGDDDGFLTKFDASGNQIWLKQFGTSAFDAVHSVAADSVGGLYVTGSTQGSLGGPSAGNYDAFVSKYSSNGSLLWTKQLGTGAEEESRAIAVDMAGNVAISGSTYGSLAAPNQGQTDFFVAKFAVPEPCTPLLLAVGGSIFLLMRVQFFA